MAVIFEIQMKTINIHLALKMLISYILVANEDKKSIPLF